MAFFRGIFDEIAPRYTEIDAGTMSMPSVSLVRRPCSWSGHGYVWRHSLDLAAGLVGGMGMAACAEIGDETGLFQPPMAARRTSWDRTKPTPWRRFSGALMLDYLAEKKNEPALSEAAAAIDRAVFQAFSKTNCGQWNSAGIDPGGDNHRRQHRSGALKSGSGGLGRHPRVERVNRLAEIVHQLSPIRELLEGLWQNGLADMAADLLANMAGDFMQDQGFA